MKIIVISITEYKEKDGIIDAVSEQGAVSFLVRGLFDPKSKNACLSSTLVVADVEFSEGKFNKYPVAKASCVLLNPRQYLNDYYGFSSLMLISETVKKLLQSEEQFDIFPWLENACKAFKEKVDSTYISLVITANVLKISGYEFEVNHCVFCGENKGIVAFSFRDGGFVCKNCVDDTTERGLTGEQMLLLRDLFRAKDCCSLSKYYSIENGKAILSKFSDFIVESFSIHLTSMALLLK